MGYMEREITELDLDSGQRVTVKYEAYLIFDDERNYDVDQMSFHVIDDDTTEIIHEDNIENGDLVFIKNAIHDNIWWNADIGQ